MPPTNSPDKRRSLIITLVIMNLALLAALLAALDLYVIPAWLQQ